MGTRLEQVTEKLLYQSVGAGYSLATEPNTVPKDYNYETSFIDEDTGFKAVVLFNNKTGDRVVSFAGTEPHEGQDIAVDLNLGSNKRQ